MSVSASAPTRPAVLDDAPVRLARRRRPIVGRFGTAAWVLLAVLVACIVLGPLVWSDVTTQNVSVRLSGPRPGYLFGTDHLGRDLLARLLVGGRWSLLGAAVVTIGTALIGLLVGAVAAIGSRVTDLMLSRLVETLLAIPGLVTALAVTAVLGPSFGNLLLAIVLTAWPWYARAYRSLILRESRAGYVEGAVAAGAATPRLLLRHILPNIVGPVAVIATVNLGSVILNLAALSFLGLGMQPPTPEWGSMINEARPFFQRAPWQMIAPGLCIVLTVLAVNLSGDALRDALDPRLTTRR